MAERTGRTGSSLLGTASLRLRVTGLAVLVVGVALVVGSVILVHLLQSSLVESAKTSTEAQADSIATLLESGSNPDNATVTDIDDDEDQFVQILDDEGTVVAASDNVVGQNALGNEGDEVTVPFDSDPFIVADSDADTGNGERTVVVGNSLEDARDAASSLTSLLLVGAPLLMLIVGATTWFAVGRTLAPVERIRREADEITGTELHRRLPEPGGRDEIGRLARTMNQMLGRIDQAQQQQRRFVSDAAHELRSPVASIKQNLEVATDYPDHLSIPELLETVRSESTRLERLTTALLSLARLDERSQHASTGVVDVDDLVFAEAGRLRTTSRLHIDTAKVSAGRVLGDEALLSQALRNLVDNAERHAQNTLAFSLVEDGRTVRLTVEDDGSGIPEGEAEHVFARFVRLDEARGPAEGGSGLGLAIVHDIVNAHHGTVVADRSHLGGARLTITLPLPGDEA